MTSEWSPKSNPQAATALRFLIGHELRLTRERAGMKQIEAGKVLGCSQAKINYLETGKTQQKPAEVTKLLKAYGVDVEHLDRLASLAGRADQSVWWAPFSDALPDWFKIFVGLEGLAVSQSTFESRAIPGQLQTPEYAAALLEGNLRVPPMDIGQVVRGRMARQRLADESNPLRLRAVIEEHVLDRAVGGPGIMRAQLTHLLDLMRRDNVEVHVVPIAVPVHDGLEGDFLLLNFDEAQSIGYIEYPDGAIYIQDQAQVATYALSMERLCSVALSVPDSVDAVTTRIIALDAISED